MLRCARQLKPKSRRRLPRCCAPSGWPVEPCVRQLPHTVFAAYGTAPGIEPSATTLANAHQIVLRRLIKAARKTLVICTYGQHRAGTFGAALHRWAFSALPILLRYHRFRSSVDDVPCRKTSRIIVQNCQNHRTVYPPISLPAAGNHPKWQWIPSGRSNSRLLRRRRPWSFPPHSRA